MSLDDSVMPWENLELLAFELMQIFSDEMYTATAYYVNENILKPISSYVQSNPLTHEMNSILRPNRSV